MRGKLIEKPDSWSCELTLFIAAHGTETETEMSAACLPMRLGLQLSVQLVKRIIH
jgi:hypothetical protein